MILTTHPDDFYQGVPDYEEKPEPVVPVGGYVFDAVGFPWTKHPDGWMAAGDERVQLWPDIQKWFAAGGETHG